MTSYNSTTQLYNNKDCLQQSTNLATSDDSTATDPSTGEFRLQCSPAGQNKKRPTHVGKAPITEDERRIGCKGKKSLRSE